MKMDEDHIRIWKCKCGCYEINFPAIDVYCHHCGEKMEARIYKEVLPPTKK